MSGFFGAGVFETGVILGNLLAKGGQFGPIFKVSAVTPPGNQLIVSIVAAANSNGPFTPPPFNSYEFGAGLGTGTINNNIPCFVNGALVLVMGQYSNSVDGFHYNVLGLAGALAQNTFIDMQFDDGTGFVSDLTSASAGFNAPYTLPGGTTWAWQVPAGHEFAPLNLPYTINW